MKSKHVRWKKTTVAGVIWLFLTVPALARQRPQEAAASDDGLKLLLRGRVLLQNDRDGFMSISQVRYSPTRRHFVAIGCGYECNDNVGFLFRRDGTGKRQFTSRWDFILQNKLEWSADGGKLFYYRISSSGAEAPRSSPAPGWVEVNVLTGRKGAAASRRLKLDASYGVFNAADGLVVRAAPGTAAKEVGRLVKDATGVRVTGRGRLNRGSTWVPVRYQNMSGWVNQNFLFEIAGRE